MALYQPKTAQATAALSTEDDQVAALRTELANEQERLRKLWDAFKVQEDELAQLRNAVPTLASAPAPVDTRATESMRREIDLLTGDLRRAAEAQRTLEEENQALRESMRDHSDLGHTKTRLESELAGERERLAKLFAVYEEVDAERVRLVSRLKEWDAWFHGAAPHIEELARSIHGAPRNP